jgi:hypothetical protein
MQSVAQLKSLSIALTSALSLLAWSGATPSRAAGKFPADAPEVVVQTRCPPLRTYDTVITQKAGAEMGGLLKADPSAAAPGMITDYKLLRDQCRAYAK